MLLRTGNGNERVNGGKRVAALDSDASVCLFGAARESANAYPRAKRVDLPEAGAGCGARPSQERRRPSSRASGRTAWAEAGIVLAATLVLRTWGAPHTEGFLAAAGTESSCAAGGRKGWSAQSRDLWGHRRQIQCCVAARGRWTAAHRAWIETDWMFAPCRTVCLARLADSGLAGRRRNRAGCIPGTSLNAPTEAEDRNSSLASRRRKSWWACIPGQRGIAQQMLDLQKFLQTDVRYSARTVSSNLTADTPVVVWRPLAVAAGLGEDATRGWR